MGWFLIKIVNGSEPGESEKEYMKINSNDNLLLNKILELHMLMVTVISVLEEDSKHYS